MKHTSFHFSLALLFCPFVAFATPIKVSPSRGVSAGESALARMYSAYAKLSGFTVTTDDRWVAAGQRTIAHNVGTITQNGRLALRTDYVKSNGVVPRRLVKLFDGRQLWTSRTGKPDTRKDAVLDNALRDEIFAPATPIHLLVREAKFRSTIHASGAAPLPFRRLPNGFGRIQVHLLYRVTEFTTLLDIDNDGYLRRLEMKESLAQSGKRNFHLVSRLSKPMAIDSKAAFDWKKLTAASPKIPPRASFLGKKFPLG